MNLESVEAVAAERGNERRVNVDYPIRIPADEVVDAMKEVGDSLPCALKETAQGGLANTPTARRMRESVFGTQNAK